MGDLLTVLYCVLGPLGIMYMTYRSKALRKVGDIILAYIVGCVVGLSGIIPQDAQPTLTLVATASIPLAIPLMLLSSDVRAWAHLAPKFAKSMLTGIIGCIIAIAIGFKLFGQGDPETNAKVGGMLTGLYTGGTANQASLKMALGIPDDVYLLSHTYSIIVSALYLIFVIIFGKRALSYVLPRFEGSAESETEEKKISDHSGELFWGLFCKENIRSLTRALGLTVIIIILGAAVGYGGQLISDHFAGGADVFQAIFILTISLLSVLAATRDNVKRLERTYEAGTYFILIFSLAVSSQVSTGMLENISADFFAYITVATLGALALHILLNMVFRIDTDTTLVSSIALLCSPPFVPVMAGALGNKAVIGPGIAVGLIGYAIGTYIGFAVAWALLLI